MTSMPASRSARAIILAPRSCPSSPGLAINTRIFRCDMRPRILQSRTTGYGSSSPENASHRAIQLRSCAIRLSNGNFLVHAKHTAKRVADFAQSGIRFHGVAQQRHQIAVAFAGAHQRIEAPEDFFAGALRPQFSQALLLDSRHPFVNLEHVDRCLLAGIFIYPYDDFVATIYGYLILVRSLGDFALRVPALN